MERAGFGPVWLDGRNCIPQRLSLPGLPVSDDAESKSSEFTKLQHTGRARPLLPINFFGFLYADVDIHREIVGKQDKIIASPPRRRDDEAIAADKCHRCADFLRPQIVWLFKTLGVDAKAIEGRSDQPERPVAAHAEAVNQRRFGRARVKLRPMERNFCKRSLTLKTCVEDSGTVGRGPSAPGSLRRCGIEVAAGRPIDVPFKCFCLERAQAVNKISVVDQAGPPLNVNAVAQLIDHGHHLLRASVLNQGGWRHVLQQPLGRIEPQPRLLRFINIG